MLAVVIAAIGFVATNQGARSVIAARLGFGPSPTFAYTIIAGHISRIDPATGAILAQSPDLYGEQFPSLAVSHDGGYVFFLRSVVEDGYVNDQLVTLSATSFTPQARVPLQRFMRPMDAWPPALAVSPDDRTVIVYQYGLSESDPTWLSYYDRQTGRLTGNPTILNRCGVAQLLPVDRQLAVVCVDSADLRLVDLESHQVTATLPLDLPRVGVIGWPIATGVSPGRSALTVVQTHGSLLRVDLASRSVSLITNLVPYNGEFAPVTSAAFSANGHVAVTLAASREDRSVGLGRSLLIVDTATGRILDRLAVESRYGGMTFSPDGQRVWIVGEQDTLTEVDLTTHQVRPFGPDPSRTWVHLIFTDR